MAVIITPEILLSMINCFRRNFFLNVLMLVLNVNHHNAEPVKTPQSTVSMTILGSIAESAILNLTAVNIARIKNIEPGLVIVHCKSFKIFYVFALFILLSYLSYWICYINFKTDSKITMPPTIKTAGLWLSIKSSINTSPSKEMVE